MPQPKSSAPSTLRCGNILKRPEVKPRPANMRVTNPAAPISQPNTVVVRGRGNPSHRLRSSERPRDTQQVHEDRPDDHERDDGRESPCPRAEAHESEPRDP